VFCQMLGQLVWVQTARGPRRLQVGREALVFQGYRTAAIPATISSTSERAMQEIAGNMMSGLVLLALLQSLFAALPWCGASSRAAPTTALDVDEALAAFSILATSADADADGPAPAPAKRLRRLTIKRGSGSSAD